MPSDAEETSPCRPARLKSVFEAPSTVPGEDIHNEGTTIASLLIKIAGQTRSVREQVPDGDRIDEILAIQSMHPLEGARTEMAGCPVVERQQVPAAA